MQQQALICFAYTRNFCYRVSTHTQPPDGIRCGPAMRVCVIGAGPCGLACCKLLLDQPEIQTVVVYEQAEQLGGQWLYTDCVGTDHRGRKVHSSTYKDLMQVQWLSQFTTGWFKLQIFWCIGFNQEKSSIIKGWNNQSFSICYSNFCRAFHNMYQSLKV